MRQVILTVGPQGVGKSTFCDQIVKSYPEIVLVSRDAILMELFGEVYLDSYSSGHYVALERMWELVAEHMRRDDVTIVLDCWNGFAEERRKITKKLRSLKTDMIGAWYFITPKDISLGWRMEKVRAENEGKDTRWKKIWEDIKRDSFLHDYQLFHSQPINCGQGFNFIVKINPLNPPPFESLFQKVRQLS